jgi:hypothetical protein
MPATATRFGRMVFGLMAVSTMSSAPFAGSAKEGIASARAAVSNMTPRDVGARYGQARGAVEVCTGTKTTDRVSALDAIYTGADLEAFKTQAAKIYDAWIKVKRCVGQDDPNQCAVIMDESCAAAITEIGPAGTVLPGLLEAAKH